MTASEARLSSAAAERVRRAVDSALECLDRLAEIDGATEADAVGRSAEIRTLTSRARGLRAEVDAWRSAPPAQEGREAAIREALSLQLAAVALSRSPAP